MATERIIITVSENGSRTVRREIENIGVGARSAEGAVTLLRRALGLLGGALATNELVRLADTYTNIQNRLRLVTTGTQNLTRVTNDLFDISNRTRSSYESTAELYSRVALAAKDLGTSQQDLLQFTESLNQAVILSGASSTEANAAIIQLSQGIASGALRGDELRSVLEQLPAVADVIAQHLGVTRGELRQMGQDGKITAQVVLESFKAAREELAGRFATTIPTIGQSLTVLKNNFMQLWGEFVTGNGLAQGLAQAILFLANHLDTVIPLVIGVGTAFAAWRVTSIISGILGPMLALERALGATGVASGLFSIGMKAAQGAVNGLTIAIAANPIGAIAVALTAVIALLYAFRNEIKVSSDGVVSLGNFFQATWELASEAFTSFISYFQSAWEAAMSAINGVLEVFGTTFGALLEGLLAVAKGMINGYIGLWVFAFRAVTLIWNNFPGAMDAFFTAVVNLGAAAAEALLNAWQAPLRLIAGGLSIISDEAGATLSGFLDNFNIRIPRRVASDAGQQFSRDLAGALTSSVNTDYVGNALGAVMTRARQIAGRPKGGGGDLAGAGTNRVTPPAGPGAGAGDNGANELARQQETWAEYLKNLQQETVLAGLSNRERARAQSLYRIEDQLKRQLTQTERDLANAALDRLQAAQDTKILDDTARQLERENQLLQANRSEREQLTRIYALEDQLGRQLTDAEKARITTLMQENDALKAQDEVLQSIRGPQEDLQRRQDALNALFEAGKISIDEYTRAMRDLAVQLTATDNTLQGGLENGLARLAQKANEFGKSVSDAVVAMGTKIEDQFVNLVKNGKFSFKDLADFAIEQFVRIMAQQAIAQLAGMFGGGGGGGFGGGGGGLGGVIMSLFGGGGGFANGGGFTVPGSGTTDSKLVMFRATPGENVDITHPGKGQTRPGQGGDNHYNIRVEVKDPGNEENARRSGKAIARQVGRAIQRVSADLPR